MGKVIQADLFSGAPLRDAQSFRSDRELMALPFFTPGRTPVHEGFERSWVEQDGTKRFIRNSPGEDGLPTIFDYDILSYLQTLVVGRLNRGEPVFPRMTFVVNDCLAAIRRGNGGREYDLFLQSLKRLKGTSVYTNVESADVTEDSGWSWITAFALRKRKTAGGKEIMTSCEVTLCDWVFNAIVKEKRFLSLPPEYFDIQGGLERKLFLVIFRHLGNQASWWIGLDRLYVKTGSLSEFKRFSYEVRKMAERDPFPDWELKVTTDNRPLHMGGATSSATKSRKTPMFLHVTRRSTLRLVPPVTT